MWRFLLGDWFRKRFVAERFYHPLDYLNKHFRCPDCESPYFIMGPMGGLAVNIKCAGCGHKFCFAPPFTPQRIDNDDSLYTRPAVQLAKRGNRGMTTLLPVHCCCHPMIRFGWVPVPVLVTHNRPIRFPLPDGKILYTEIGELWGIFECHPAIKSNHEPIEVWRQVPGFIEDETQGSEGSGHHSR